MRRIMGTGLSPRMVPNMPYYAVPRVVTCVDHAVCSSHARSYRAAAVKNGLASA